MDRRHARGSGQLQGYGNDDREGNRDAGRDEKRDSSDDEDEDDEDDGETMNGMFPE